MEAIDADEQRRRDETIGRYQKLAKQHDRFDRADKQQRAAQENFPQQKPRNNTPTEGARGEMIWQKQSEK